MRLYILRAELLIDTGAVISVIREILKEIGIHGLIWRMRLEIIPLALKKIRRRKIPILCGCFGDKTS